MKPSKMFLAALLLASLTACGQDGSSADPALQLYEADSSIILSGYGAADSIGLPTYRHAKYGEVPYVELGKLISFIASEDIDAPKVTRLGEGLYAIESDGIICGLVNTHNDSVIMKRQDYMVRAFMGGNNGIYGDIASSNPAPESSVHPSHKTVNHGEYEDEVYDLREYDMDLVEMDGKAFVPMQFFANMIFRGLGADMLYNGHDYFLTGSNSVAFASCYTANDTFRYGSEVFSPLENVPVGESKRYVAANASSKSDKDKYHIFALNNDGSGAYFAAASKDAALEGEPSAKLVWEKKADQDTYIGVKNINPATKQWSETPSYFRVRHGQEYYNSKKRDISVAKFTYNLLRFQFDELYGLRPELKQKQGYVDFDSFVTAKGLKNDLMSLDSETYDKALAQFTMTYVDDGHTSYSARSIYSGETKESASDLVGEYAGTRIRSLLAKREEYTALRTKVTGDDNAIGYFMEGETAVIRFDAFAHIAAIIPALPDDAESYGIKMMMSLSTPFGFDISFKHIKENPAIKNVVLDLTCNVGGMVLTLPYLAAYFTKDPYILNFDTLSGVLHEFHYSVDLNHNGVYGDAEDTYAGKYNFYLLTSDLSFSCGTAFPAMARMAGVKTIGKRSGGGACSVSAYSDGTGSIYNTSSPLQIGTLDKEGKFINDDAGIPVDYELAPDSWYDLKKLDTFVKGLINA